jgi:maltodextrin utilization protein YvdJ
VKEIIVKIQELYNTLQARLKTADGLTLKLNGEIEYNKQQNAKFSDKEKELQERESKVSHIENAVEYREATDNLRTQLSKEREVFEKEKASTIKTTQEKENSLKMIRKELDAKEEFLNNKEKALEEEKKTFKAKIIEEVNKTLQK